MQFVFNLFAFLYLLLRNQITFYSNDHIEFNENYLRSLQVQSIRSKIFLYFIDTYSLECEWFLYNFIYAHVNIYPFFSLFLSPIFQTIRYKSIISCRFEQLFFFSFCLFTFNSNTALIGLVSLSLKSHNLLNHLPILLPVIFDQELESESHNKSKQKLLNQLVKDCIVYIKMSEV